MISVQADDKENLLPWFFLRYNQTLISKGL